MPEVNPNFLLVAFVVALAGFLIGLSKGGLGGGLGALVTPLLSLVMPNVALAVGTLLPMLIVGDFFAVRSYWGEWDGPLTHRPLLGALPGVLAGTFLLVNLPVNTMRQALAAFTLVVIAYKVLSDRIKQIRYQPHPWHGWIAGGLTGLTSSLFNAGGPPFNAYLLLQQVPPQTFIATTAVFFGILNLLKLVSLNLANPPSVLYSRVINLRLLASLWWAFLFIPLGNWAGRWLIQRIHQRAFEAIIVGLLVLSSVLLFWQSR